MMRDLTYLLLALCCAVPTMAQRSSSNWKQYTSDNSALLDNTILATTTDRSGNIWIGTSQGLCRLSSQGQWTDFSQFNAKLKGQFVNCLTVDGSRNLWIGTDDYGVIKYDGRNWTEYSEKTRVMKMKFIREITIDKNNVKWIGVTLGGLVSYDDMQWYKYTSQNSKLLSDFILCVAIDRGNRKWIGTNDGLSVFNDHVWKNYTTENSPLPHNIIPSIVTDNNIKWMGTLGGVVRYDDKEWKVYDDRNTPLPSLQVNALALDKNGMLWVVTDEGVALFDCKSNWITFTHENSPLPKNGITSIVVDAQGNKWIGTTFGGLFRYSGQGVKGRVTDAIGQGVQGVTVTAGDMVTSTDADGYYHLEAETGSSLTITPDRDGKRFSPSSRYVTDIKTFTFQQDFVMDEGSVADNEAPAHSDSTTAAAGSSRKRHDAGEAHGKSTERVMVTPYLQQGYITITMESPTAEVEFVDSKGKSVRTVPQYKNGARIVISRMPKDHYMLYVRTVRGEKSLKFNLK